MQQRRAIDRAAIVDDSRLLHLEAIVISESNPHKEIKMCVGCVRRERKRAERKKGGPSDEHSFEQDRDRILLFNCEPLIHFSSGDAILPTRITCYCRHHNEHVGFRVRFTLRTSKGVIVATGESNPIMITDDHKNAKQGQKRSRIDLEESPSQASSRRESSCDITPALSSTILMEQPVLRSTDSSYNPLFLVQPDQKHFDYLPQDKHNQLYQFRDIPSSYTLSPGFLPEYPIYQSSYQRQTAHDGNHESVHSTLFASPQVERLVPSQGPMNGSTEVTILGSGFYEGITCLFGDCAATTVCWSPCTLVCVVPSVSQPGPVIVSFKGHPLTPKRDNVTMFNYLNSNDQALFELALQLVGMKMTGNLQDAKQVALRIVQGGQEKPKQTSNLDRQIAYTTSKTEWKILPVMQNVGQYTTNGGLSSERFLPQVAKIRAALKSTDVTDKPLVAPFEYGSGQKGLSKTLAKMNRVNTRIFPKIPWVHPKDRVKRWNIVTGDKVAVIAGRDKDTIGEVKRVNRQTNTVIVEGKKLAKKHIEKQPAAPDGILRVEQPIHVSNVMLLHPETQVPTRVEYRQVETTLEDGRVVSRLKRFAKGTDVEIPKPKQKYNDKSGAELFSTVAEEALKVTYVPDASKPPIPQDLLKELRNIYKKHT
ncbi:SPT3 Dosage dependent suppressor of Ty-induced promoter mutations-like protein [Apophysomyces sp. BC1034]|nr:SPT3 Dosage dependent suppressor of Ty-induced promoter mutations-like protein [Apophysomyces sp. BC1021]KAG0191273.1 SPT3 Dosage dependent suppressor of Ty-induced promoter mutations-like protein [Apophysomyces sp. BC1034]